MVLHVRIERGHADAQIAARNQREVGVDRRAAVRVVLGVQPFHRIEVPRRVVGPVLGGEAPGGEVLEHARPTLQGSGVGLAESRREQIGNQVALDRIPGRHRLSPARRHHVDGVRQPLRVALSRASGTGADAAGEVGDRQNAVGRHGDRGQVGAEGEARGARTAALREDLDHAVRGLRPVQGRGRGALRDLDALDGLGRDVVEAGGAALPVEALHG